jgi:chemotaxis protein MotB
MARKKKHEEANHGADRWLITYADLITLLLVFFIIMYAMSKIDIEKYKVLAQVLNLQFNKADSIIQRSDNGISGVNHPPVNKPLEKDQQDKPNGTVADPASQQREAAKLAEEQKKKDAELKNLLDKINAYIQENKLEAQVSAADKDRGITITLNDLFLFDLGRADLKAASYPILDKLSTLIPTLNTKVSIEGHTDDLPLATGSVYGDNWGLSNARSLSVLHYFTQKAKMPDKTFISTGYADTEPKVPNTSDANRAQNRRVEIVVLREPMRVSP